MRKFYFFALLLFGFGSILAQTQIQMPLPAHSTTFPGNVRGYWFVAPTCFTITGLEVPSEAGTGAQNIAVMRLPAAPPIFSATTNVFTTLFLTQNNPATGIIPCNIQIEQGDNIMILGQRDNINSYSASGTFTATINGQSMAITRCGMQFPLATTAPTQLWAQASGSISRVWMYYDSVLTFNATATPSGPSSYTFSNAADSSFISVWNYGDGSPLDTVWNGSHTYSTGGTFNVCSYVTTSCGTDTVCTTVTVCGPDPISNFGAAATGFAVTFADSSSNAASWHWDFGDGSSDTTANPTHTYAAIGWYTVCLTTMNACMVADTVCDSVFVCVAPTAGMSYQNVGNNTLVFSNSSMYASSYWWDFGDGTTDTTANPTHIYTIDSTYTICLITTNACGSDTTCTTVTICVTPLAASFTYSNNFLDFFFMPTVTGGSLYLWDFGDGSTDTSTFWMVNHTYGNNLFTYTVCLTVWNDCGDSTTYCDTVPVFVVGTAPTMPDFAISVAPKPMAQQAVVLVQNSGLQGIFDLQILDLRGALVKRSAGEFNVPMVLQANDLAQGIYLYRVMHDGTMIGTGKLIVE